MVITLTSTAGSGFLETDFDQIKTLIDGLADNSISTNNAKVSCTTSNVTSAGALMDSEITNLAQVKAFDSSDYATATQGGTADSAMQDLVDDTTPQLGGDLDWNSNGAMLVGQTVAGSNGDLVYLSSANTWTQADADAEASCSGMLGIRISATTVLTHGVYTTSGLTAAAIQYASTTAGGITETAPSETGDIVRVIGYALSTTELFFDPDKSYIEVA